MGILRDRMVEEMKLRNFSPATQVSYVYAVSRLARYHHKSPDQLSKEDIRAFLVHLTVERSLSPNSLTGYCYGLRFFYNETLGGMRTSCLSLREEAFSPARGVQSRRGRAIMAQPGSQATCFTDDPYSAGLRVRELVNLKITDIDAARMTLRVKQAKAARTAMPSYLRNCLWSCASIGNVTGLQSGFFPIEPRTVR